MKARYLLGVVGLGACQLIFQPSDELFLETTGNNCFDGADNDGKNGADCEDPVCAEICNDDQLFIGALTSNNCTTRAHQEFTEDGRGGIAVGEEHILLSGKTRTVGFSVDALDATLYPALYDVIFSDLRSGKVYTLLNKAGQPISGPSGSAISLQEINSRDGTLIGTPLTLSQPVIMGGVGVFSGKGRVVLASDGALMDVNIADGAVTALGEVALNHQECANKAFWGVAEFVNGELSLVYASSRKTITRYTVSIGEEEILSGFGDLGDMCAITVAPREARWYFHASPPTTLSTIGEHVGYCDAVFSLLTSPSVCGDGIAQPPEQCDDGNQLGQDGCTACVLDACGDGVVNQIIQGSRFEACDDGNTTFGDGCRGDCLGAETCGDDLLDSATERCDDGNDANGDGCESDCTLICAASINPMKAFFDSTSSRCYAVPNFFATWEAVRQNCISLGGDLASITSIEEQTLILPSASFGPWIGLSDIATEGSFVWNSGEAFSFESFAEGEPNNSGEEDCIGLFASGEWNDFSCNAGAAGLCEFDCAADPALCD